MATGTAGATVAGADPYERACDHVARHRARAVRSAAAVRARDHSDRHRAHRAQANARTPRRRRRTRARGTDHRLHRVGVEHPLRSPASCCCWSSSCRASYRTTFITTPPVSVRTSSSRRVANTCRPAIPTSYVACTSIGIAARARSTDVSSPTGRRSPSPRKPIRTQRGQGRVLAVGAVRTQVHVPHVAGGRGWPSRRRRRPLFQAPVFEQQLVERGDRARHGRVVALVGDRVADELELEPARRSRR